jgi:hypothetical protein
MSLYDAKRMARYLQKVHGEVEVYLDDLDSSQPGVRITGKQKPDTMSGITTNTREQKEERHG